MSTTRTGKCKVSKDKIVDILKQGGGISHCVNCYRLYDVDGFVQRCTITHATIVALLDNLRCVEPTVFTHGELCYYLWREDD